MNNDNLSSYHLSSNYQSWRQYMNLNTQILKQDGVGQVLLEVLAMYALAH